MVPRYKVPLLNTIKLF